MFMGVGGYFVTVVFISKGVFVAVVSMCFRESEDTVLLLFMFTGSRRILCYCCLCVLQGVGG